MPLDAAKAKSSYVVGLEDSDLPPYSGYDGKVIAGVLKQILDKISQNLTVDFSFFVGTPLELAEKLKKGEIDFRLPDNPGWKNSNDERIFSLPLITFTDCFYQMAGRALPVGEKLRCGSVEGYSLPANKTGDFISGYHWYDSNHSACQALLDGDVDILYGNMTALPLVAEELDGLDLQPFGHLPALDGFYHLGALPKHKTVLQEIDHWIDRNRRQLYAWNGESEIKL